MNISEIAFEHADACGPTTAADGLDSDPDTFEFGNRRVLKYQSLPIPRGINGEVSSAVPAAVFYQPHLVDPVGRQGTQVESQEKGM